MNIPENAGAVDAPFTPFLLQVGRNNSNKTLPKIEAMGAFTGAGSRNPNFPHYHNSVAVDRLQFELVGVGDKKQDNQDQSFPLNCSSLVKIQLITPQLLLFFHLGLSPPAPIRILRTLHHLNIISFFITLFP